MNTDSPMTNKPDHSGHDAEASLREARARFPLARVLEQFGVQPKNGNWKSVKCPFCQKSGAGITVRNGVEFFKCFHNTCPTGAKALTDILFIAQVSNLSNREAFTAFLKMAGVWKERTVLKSSPGPAVGDGAAGKSEAGSPVQPSAAPSASPDALQEDDPPPEITDAAADEVANAALQLPPDASEAASDADPLLAQAIELAKTEKISGRRLQKRFGIRAARAYALATAAKIASDASGKQLGSGEVLPGSASDASGKQLGSVSGVPGEQPTTKPKPAKAAEPKVKSIPEGAASDEGGDEAEEVEEPEELKAVRAFYSKLTLSDEDANILWQKRGLLRCSVERLGLRSSPKTNAELLRWLQDEFPLEVLEDSGLWTRYDGGRTLAPNDQFYGNGITGKDDEGEFTWGWAHPVLIPYLEDGKLVGLRPHKGMSKAETALGRSRLYVPDWQAGQRFMRAVITEGEFKADALWQQVGGGWGGLGDKCATRAQAQASPSGGLSPRLSVDLLLALLPSTVYRGSS